MSQSCRDGSSWFESVLKQEIKYLAQLRAQHSDWASGETLTSNPSILSLMLYHMGEKVAITVSAFQINTG